MQTWLCHSGIRTLCPSRDVALRLAAAQGFGFYCAEQPSSGGIVEPLYRQLWRALSSSGKPEHYLLTTARTPRAALVWTLAQAQQINPEQYTPAEHPAQFVARRP